MVKWIILLWLVICSFQTFANKVCFEVYNSTEFRASEIFETTPFYRDLGFKG